jgi:hypothetical protein
MENWKTRLRQLAKIVEYLPLFAVWFLLVPYLFMLLYSVLELQSAARAATGANSKLATYIVMKRASQILPLEQDLTNLADEISDDRDKYGKASAAVTVQQEQFIDTMTLFAAGLKGSDGRACSSGDTDRLDHPDHDIILACARNLIMKAYPDLEQSQLAFAQGTTNVKEHIVFVQDGLKSLKANLTAYESAYANLGVASGVLVDARRKYVAKANAYRSLLGAGDSAAIGIIDPTITDDARQYETMLAASPATGPLVLGASPSAATPAVNPTPSPSASVSAAAAAPATIDGIGSVATSYNNMLSMFLFERLFRLPPGVVVAFFTALMGALGTCVYSLLSQVLSTPREDDVWAGWVAFGVRPLLGAMAGFMVFFVVSAGAAFLVQPGATSSTEAVNSLSAPALASLGVFAGVAAERALKWLNEKATAFFQTKEEQEGAPPSAHAPAPVQPAG